MKAVVLTSLRHMEFTDLPDPEIESDTDVLLKIEAVGVCGSDVHYYETGRIGSQIIEYPFIIGHECSATVKAVGSSVTRVKVGDPVVKGARVVCRVMAHDRGRKLYVLTYKAKKNERRKIGHRQQYTRLRVKKIRAR